MGEFANRAWLQVLAWSAAALILSLDIWLVKLTVQDWLQSAGRWRVWLELGLVPLLIAISLLLAWVTLQPFFPGWFQRFGSAPIQLPQQVAIDLAKPIYTKILVPVDHTSKDRDAIAHAAAMAKQYGATLYLMHVEEGVTSQVYGSESSHRRGRGGREIPAANRSPARRTTVESPHDRAPLARSDEGNRALCRRVAPDLVVMGAHGHKGLKDIVFGTTINAVRHKLKAPLLVVRGTG